ncbi:hypothetical protein HUU05_27115 [candidate division KSB1 bacterium]|nr:hypothetical protein [candidate division KSB1 bacterium]
MAFSLAKFWHRLCSPFKAFLQGLRQHPFVAAVFSIILLVPALVILTFLVILPVANNPYEAETSSTSEEVEDHANNATDTAAVVDSAVTEELEGLTRRLLELDIQRAYLQARWELSKSDSITLSINLHDSLVSLEMKGTPIRQCRILRFEVSRALARLQAKGRLHEWLTTPFTLQKSDLATLPKAPVRVVTAPKDTLEAQARAKEEIPLEKNEVHFTLEFDRNLTLAFEQAQDLSFKGRLKKWGYELQRGYASVKEAVHALLAGELPQHRMLITLELAQEDAKAIYRALPRKAGLALYF